MWLLIYAHLQWCTRAIHCRCGTHTRSKRQSEMYKRKQWLQKSQFKTWIYQNRSKLETINWIVLFLWLGFDWPVELFLPRMNYRPLAIAQTVRCLQQANNKGTPHTPLRMNSVAVKLVNQCDDDKHAICPRIDAHELPFYKLMKFSKLDEWLLRNCIAKSISTR